MLRKKYLLCKKEKFEYAVDASNGKTPIEEI